MIIRSLALSCLLLTTPLQAAPIADTSEGVAVVTVDPVKKRAEDIDRLFADLHKDNAANPKATIEKIWALWSRNDSAMAEIILSQSVKAMRDGVFETSETMMNELLGSYPDYTEALNQRAMLYYNMKRYDDAMNDVEAVLAEEPRHFGALAGRAAIYQAQGNVAKAAAALRDAIVVNPYLETAKDALKQLEHDFPNI
jgi:tetratricopeptide (TPR) repeat protein